MGTVVEVVKLDPLEGAGTAVPGEVETMGGEEGAFLVEKRAGEGDVENGRGHTIRNTFAFLTAFRQLPMDCLRSFPSSDE